MNLKTIFSKIKEKWGYWQYIMYSIIILSILANIAFHPIMADKCGKIDARDCSLKAIPSEYVERYCQLMDIDLAINKYYYSIDNVCNSASYNITLNVLFNEYARFNCWFNITYCGSDVMDKEQLTVKFYEYYNESQYCKDFKKSDSESCHDRWFVFGLVLLCVVILLVADGIIYFVWWYKKVNKSMIEIKSVHIGETNGFDST